jgi:glycerol dehydrogenase
MISTTVFPGRYIQGYEAIKRLGSEIARLGSIGYFICSPTVYGKLLPTFRDDLEKSVKIIAEKFGGECCEEEIDRLQKLAAKTDCNIVIGMGGGKTLDTAKVIASRLKKPLIIVPTIASTDAPCSAIAVIHASSGEMKEPLFLNKNPDVVLVDSKIIAQAPVRFLVAGMGDALSKKFEAESCRAKHVPNLTMTDSVGSMTAYALANLCYQTLLEYGLIAKKACEAHSVVPALENIIEANTLLSGLAFENSGLAAAHAIETAFSFLKETHSHLHGEIVAFGTQVSLFLTNKGKDVIDEVYSFSQSVGLPTTLEEIGITRVSDSDLMKVADAVCTQGGLIYNEPTPISTDSVVAAIKAADYEGKQRKRA